MVYPNAFSQRYQYNTVNRLTTLEHVNNGTVTERFSYTLDPAGKRTRLDELNGRSTVWGYDNLNRLTSETISRNNSVEHTESYTLDAVGNRTTVTTNGVTTSYTYNANDQVLTAGNVAYSYDNNGNRLGEVDALTGDFKTYQYNAKNRLVAANTLSDTLGFQYDISGIRTAKTVNGQTTTYLVDSNRDYAQVLVEETAGVKTLYTYGHDLLSQQAANDSRYYLYDGLGSTRALADETGTILDSYEYSAYGTELSQSGATANAYRYTGEQLDEETGLYYLRARYLDPVTGFTQLDSYQGRMQEPVTLHKYLYANGAPSMWTDPSGRMTLAEVGTTLNVASNLYTAASITFNILSGNYGAAGVAAKEIAEEVVLSKLSYLKPVARMSDEGMALFSRLWSRTVKLKLGYPRNSSVLRHNMEQLLGAAPGNHQAHHIVGGAYDEGKQATQILKDQNIDVNSVMNGVFLPGCGNSGGLGAIHCGKHVRDYERTVLDLLRPVQHDKTALINKLNEIRELLLSGELRLNKH